MSDFKKMTGGKMRKATLFVGGAVPLQERELTAEMSKAISSEYETVRDAARSAATESDGMRRRTLARLRRELTRIGERDYFPPDSREKARRAVEALASTLVEV